jgi:hypothetical protein
LAEQIGGFWKRRGKGRKSTLANDWKLGGIGRRKEQIDYVPKAVPRAVPLFLGGGGNVVSKNTKTYLLL